MITPSISWFVQSKEDVEVIKEFAEWYKVSIQLAFYERKDLEFVKYCTDYSNRISSIHLPKGLTKRDYQEGGIVAELALKFDVDLFVVHPWADDLDKIVDSIVEQERFTLCLETFRINRKGGRNPIDLLAHYGRQFLTPYVGLCVDFSHLDTEVCNYPFIKGLIPYTKMIHLSDRVKKAQHLPLYRQNSDYNAAGLIGQILILPNLPVREIVLEYMKEYKPPLTKHIFSLTELIQRKRRRFGDASDAQN